MNQWFPIESKKGYQEATERFEKIHDAKKGTLEYKEMLLLAILISHYEKKTF